MAAILESLPPHHRKALLAYYTEGCPLAEAAEVNGIGLEAFRELKRAVRARFRRAAGSQAGTAGTIHLVKKAPQRGGDSHAAG
jgi:DNA-directed RNA polymerase specialized sigma24 family protein